MPELVIRPTLKFIRPFYWVAALGVVAILAADAMSESNLAWLLILPALLLLATAARHFRRRFTKVTIYGDKLRLESGVLSRTTRTIQLSKVQDVRVNQSLLARCCDIGDLTIETAGETSRLTVPGIDRPHETAEGILGFLPHHEQKGKRLQ